MAMVHMSDKGKMDMCGSYEHHEPDYHQTMKDRMDESKGMKKHDMRMMKDRMDESKGMKMAMKKK